MKKYMTRVELHRANADDYTRLHQIMQAAGFSRQVTAGDGTKYLLPTAEYYAEASASVSDVGLFVQRQISQLNIPFWYVVSEVGSMVWQLNAA